METVTLLLIILLIVMVTSIFVISYYVSYRKTSKIGKKAAKNYAKSHKDGGFEMITRHPLSYLLIVLGPILIVTGTLLILFPYDLMSRGVSLSRRLSYTGVVLIGGFISLAYGLYLFRKKSFKISQLEISFSVGSKERFKTSWGSMNRIYFHLIPDPRVKANPLGMPHVNVLSVDIEASQSRETLVSYTDLRPECLYPVAKKLREEALKYRIEVIDEVGVDSLF